MTTTLANSITFVLLLILFANPCLAQSPQFALDEFSDGDHQDHEPFNWQKGNWPGGELFVDERGPSDRKLCSRWVRYLPQVRKWQFEHLSRCVTSTPGSSERGNCVHRTMGSVDE